MTRPSSSRLGLASAAAAILTLAGGWIGFDVLHQDSPDPTTNSSTCPLASLPREAQDTVNKVHSGGPFPHPDNDGVRFGNYEGHLPKQAKNYYREYTVSTPGVNHRGARRIVTGGDPATAPQHWYYTDNHYESFCEIPDANH
ncbi:ribonuclease [Corynebacterium poyangense]|uniref:Ribonuclease n=1 Tax=Corynebacterium poyangense TaxID=2684405 RepID=A0A7H0SQ06_9CORY|nr:ribonuclease domain-containing protein [Corynebacterium poyangense]MBZ8178443.1 ribonuclease [Corynebacterium poyangense]QNQ90631.1 ribonuclease [Corynebacterium poyangense]